MTEVTYSGPLFDGQAEAVLDRYIEAAREKLAQESGTRVRTLLAATLRENKGIYESAIHAERQLDDMTVTDTPVVYGPWLEGVGSRNFPKTRFRGYHVFRQIGNGMQSEAGDIAERILHDGGYLEEMNR